LARVLLKNLSKRFEDVVAVDSLNLKVRDKEFVVFRQAAERPPLFDASRVSKPLMKGKSTLAMNW